MTRIVGFRDRKPTRTVGFQKREPVRTENERPDRAGRGRGAGGIRRWEFVIVVASFYQHFESHHHLLLLLWPSLFPFACDKHTWFLVVVTFFYYALLMFAIAFLLKLVHLQFFWWWFSFKIACFRQFFNDSFSKLTLLTLTIIFKLIKTWSYSFQTRSFLFSQMSCCHNDNLAIFDTTIGFSPIDIIVYE